MERCASFPGSGVGTSAVTLGVRSLYAETRKRKTRSVGTSRKSSCEQSVVIRVTADPEPNNAVWSLNPKCPMVLSHTYRP
jgi:hypothetical protein